MRIAMIAPLMESVPPPLYGGTERVVSVLTETLVRRGHEVTLFASGDSVTGANLVSCCPSALRLTPDLHDHVTHVVAQLGEVYRRSSDFDVIHNHNDFYAFPAARIAATPTVTTPHGRLDIPDYQGVYGSFREHPLISISDAQRTPLPGANWIRTVYNGIDLDHYQFRDKPGDYLVFLGRISPEKRPDRAIEIARDVGMRLVIAAKVDAVDRDYFEHAIKRQIESSSLIEFVGEVNESEKDELLGNAYAYLFPIDWPEPFGLTMVEAMATGTPVIASPVGSVEEIVVDGETGFMRRAFHDMVEAVDLIGGIDRRACRARAELLFSPEAMATGYESAYRQVVENALAPAPLRFPSPPLVREAR